MKGKRKINEVVIDRESVKHIANSIAMQAIDIEPKDLRHLPEFMRIAKEITVSSADKEGRHTKLRSNHFRYFEFVNKGTAHYINVEGRVSIINGKSTQQWRLHDITKKIK